MKKGKSWLEENILVEREGKKYMTSAKRKMYSRHAYFSLVYRSEKEMVSELMISLSSEWKNVGPWKKKTRIS